MSHHSSAGLTAIFPTALGWFGLHGREGVLTALTFGHDSANGVRSWLRQRHLRVSGKEQWSDPLRERLERYSEGHAEDFSDVSIQRPSGRSQFENQVVQVVRLVRYGLTLSYAEVARLAGSPGAARAVGRVMATNPLPIIVPCHRVIGARGSLGGYSAPHGLLMKQHLLDMEADVAETKTEGRDRLRRTQLSGVR